MRCVGGNLRVVTERQSSIGLMHGPCLRVASARPSLPLGFFSGLTRLPLLHLFQRTLEPFLLLAARTHLRLLCFRTTFVIPRIAHLRYPMSRLLQMLADRPLFEFTSGACLP